MQRCFGARVALRCPVLQPGSPRAHQGELYRCEKTICQDDETDGNQV
jgi:hypothetical protein